MPNLPTGRSKQFIVKPSAHGLIHITEAKMATKTGKAQSTNNDSLLYAVDQMAAILEMLKDVK
jgi:predicted outer membrane protein